MLDEWFSKIVQPRCRDEAYFYRFADDFVACFQYREEAESYRLELDRRVRRFGLELAPEKTRCMEFGRFAREDARKRGEKPKEFSFLGFTHYCGKTKRGRFKVKRRTDRKKMGQSLRRFADWAKRSRSWLSKGEMLRRARTRVIGHLNYYAITDNADQCDRFVYYATRLLFKWLNRKSQRRAYTWEGFIHALEHVGWPKPRIRIDLNPYRRAEAY